MENARRTSQSAEAAATTPWAPHTSRPQPTRDGRRRAHRPGAPQGHGPGAEWRTRRARGPGERADSASARTRRARGLGERAAAPGPNSLTNVTNWSAHAMTRRQRHSPVTHTHTVARHSRSPALVASPSLQKSRITLQLALVASVALATSTCKPRGSGSRWRRARPLVARSHRPSSTLPTRAPP